MSLNVEVIFDMDSKGLSKDLSTLSKGFKQLSKQAGGTVSDSASFGRSVRRLDNDVQNFTRNTRRATDQIDKFGDEARESIASLRGIGGGLFQGVQQAFGGLQAALQGDITGALGGLTDAAQSTAKSIASMWSPLWLLLPKLLDSMKKYRNEHKLLIPFLKKTKEAEEDRIAVLKDSAEMQEFHNDNLLAEVFIAGKAGKAIQDLVGEQRKSSEESKKFSKNMDDSGKASLGLIKNLGLGAVAMGAIVTASAAVVAALATIGVAMGALVVGAKAVQSWADFTKQVEAFKRLTGGSLQQAEKMTRVFKRVGLDLNDTSEIMAEFAGQQQKVIKAWPDFTWDDKDMSKNIEQAMLKLADMEDATKRNQLAFELFGEEGAKQLLPLITNADALRKTLTDEPWIDEQDIEQINRMSTAWSTMKTAVEGVLVKIGSELAPLITPALEGLATLVETKLAPALKSFFDELILGFQQGSGAGDSFGQSLGSALRNIYTWVKKAYEEQIKPFFEYVKKIGKDPDIQYLINVVLPFLGKVIGVTLYGAIVLAIGGFKMFMDTLRGISKVIQGVTDAIGWLIDKIKGLISWLGRIPKIPSWFPGFGSSKQASAQAFAVPMTTSPTTTAAPTQSITITVNGAGDPYATARQIQSLLGRQSARLQGKPTWIGSAA